MITGLIGGLKSFGKWLNDNRSLIGNALGVAGFAACVFATAGACMVVATIGLVVTEASRGYDFYKAGNYGAGAWARLGGNIAVDWVAYRFRSVRSLGLFGNGERDITLAQALDPAWRSLAASRLAQQAAAGAWSLSGGAR